MTDLTTTEFDMRFAARMSALGVSDERIRHCLVGAAYDALVCGLDPETAAEVEFELLKDFARPRFRLERRQPDPEPSNTFDRRYVLASVAMAAIAVWIVARPTTGSGLRDREPRRPRHPH
jgi:hypothetical protein